MAPNTMAARLAGIWLLALLLPTGSQAETIKQIIEVTPELSELKGMFKNFNSDHYSRVLGNNNARYTFFAPSNRAFLELPKDLSDILSRSSLQGRDKFKKLMLYHTADHIISIPGVDDTPIRSTDFTEQVKDVDTMQGSKAFYFKTPQHHYVNNARLTTMDITASNGIIHILDAVMNPVGEENSILSIVQDSQNTMYSEFAKLLSTHTHGQAISCMRDGKIFSTAFIPTNEAFADIPTTVLFQLKNSADQLQKVIDSHVICNKVLPVTVLNDTVPDEIPAVDGLVKTSRFRYDLYVKNDCVQGKILPDSVTASNGVIHPINKILGFKHNNLLEEINNRRDLSRFYGHIESSTIVRDELNWQGLPGTVVSQGKIFTIFAVTDAAMDGVDLTQLELDNILHYHMIQGYYTVADMQNNVKKNTLGRNTVDNRLSAMGVTTSVDPQTGLTDIYVEVNNVMGKVIKGDICVKNGLLHIVDNLLGMPTEETMEFIFDRNELNLFGKYVNDVGLVSDLNFKTMTLFAPTKTAFARMEKTNVGQQLLNIDNLAELQKVLERHIVIGEGLILTDSNVPQALQSEYDEISVKKSGDKFYVTFNGNQDVLITYPNIRTKTAVVHIIEEVMYVDDPQALISRSSQIYPSFILFVAILFLYGQLS